MGAMHFICPMGKVPAVTCDCKAAFASSHLVSCCLLLTIPPLMLFVSCCQTQECFATALASFETPLVAPAVPVLALPTSAPPQEPIASPTDKVSLEAPNRHDQIMAAGTVFRDGVWVGGLPITPTLHTIRPTEVLQQGQVSHI